MGGWDGVERDLEKIAECMAGWQRAKFQRFGGENIGCIIGGG